VYAQRKKKKKKKKMAHLMKRNETARATARPNGGGRLVRAINSFILDVFDAAGKLIPTCAKEVGHFRQFMIQTVEVAGNERMFIESVAAQFGSCLDKLMKPTENNYRETVKVLCNSKMFSYFFNPLLHSDGGAELLPLATAEPLLKLFSSIVLVCISVASVPAQGMAAFDSQMGSTVIVQLNALRKSLADAVEKVEEEQKNRAAAAAAATAASTKKTTSVPLQIAAAAADDARPNDDNADSKLTEEEIAADDAIPTANSDLPA
jgi:hypothetical protein